MSFQLNRATEFDIGQQIERLCSVFGKPYQANAKVMAAEWHRSLSPRFSLPVIKQAVDFCGDNAPKFPTLKQFRDACFEIERQTQPEKAKGLREQHREWETQMFDPTVGPGVLRPLPCPVCGSCIELTARGDLMVHDDRIHTEKRISYSNFGRVEWRDLGPLEDPKPKPRSHRVADNPAAKPLPALADVVKAEAAKTEIRRAIEKRPAEERAIWQDVPLPDAPPDAVLATR